MNEYEKIYNLFKNGLKSHLIRKKYLEEQSIYEYIIKNSSFLPEDAKISERIYVVINKLQKEDVLCKYCKKEKRKFINYNAGYRDTCSIQCGSIYRDYKTQKQRAQKALSKLQKDYPEYDFSNAEYKGVQSLLEIVCTKGHKFTETYENLRYIKEHCPECNRLQKQKDFIKKSKEIYGDMFDYTKTYFTSMNDDVIVIRDSKEYKLPAKNHLSIKDGVAERINSTMKLKELIKEKNIQVEVQGEYENSHTPIKLKCLKCSTEFKTLPNYIVSGSTNCPKCNPLKITKEVFLKRMKDLNLDTEYELVSEKFIGVSEHHKFKCKKHNLMFSQVPNSLLKGFRGCPKCNSTSQVQEELYDLIAKYTKAIMNDRQLIKPKEIDILVPEFKFGIEYNGMMFHSSGLYTKGKIQNSDKNHLLDKTILVEEKGYQLIHIAEYLYKKSPEIFHSMILGKMKQHRKVFARKCSIKNINNFTKNKFLAKNHLQGTCASKWNYGLFLNDELLSVMTFGVPRFAKKYDYELIRFATVLNTTVVGGGSKLLKYFEREIKPKSIISYANRDISIGNFYEKVGFSLLKTSGPGYIYFHDDQIISRYSTFKSKLKKFLPEFYPDLSEEENMFLNHYRKFYNTGNLTYTKFL